MYMGLGCNSKRTKQNRYRSYVSSPDQPNKQKNLYNVASHSKTCYLWLEVGGVGGVIGMRVLWVGGGAWLVL